VACFIGTGSVVIDRRNKWNILCTAGQPEHSEHDRKENRVKIVFTGGMYHDGGIFLVEKRGHFFSSKCVISFSLNIFTFVKRNLVSRKLPYSLHSETASWRLVFTSLSKGKSMRMEK